MANVTFDGRYPGVCQKLLAQTPLDSAFRGIVEFTAGVETGLEYRLDEATALIRTGTERAAYANAAVFAKDRAFQTMLACMMRDANLLEPSTFDAEPYDVTLPDLTIVGRQTALAGDTLLIATCDGHYFRHYHERFLASVTRDCPDQDVLLHVVNPGPGVVSLLESMAAAHPRLWTSVEQGPPYKVYYAANRFLIAERIMEQFGCHIVTVDADGVFHAGFPTLLERAHRRDVAYLRVPGQVSLPCLISAAFLFVRNSEIGRRFLRLNSGYLVRKLATDPIWMVDQAALYRTVCLTRADRACISDIHDLLDAPFDVLAALVDRHILPHDSRHKGRVPFGVCPQILFTADAKPVYQTPFNIWSDR